MRAFCFGGGEIIPAMIKLFVGLGNPGPEYEARVVARGFVFRAGVTEADKQLDHKNGL